jgi:hypothetical protein
MPNHPAERAFKLPDAADWLYTIPLYIGDWTKTQEVSRRLAQRLGLPVQFVLLLPTESLLRRLSGMFRDLGKAYREGSLLGSVTRQWGHLEERSRRSWVVKSFLIEDRPGVWIIDSAARKFVRQPLDEKHREVPAAEVEWILVEPVVEGEETSDSDNGTTYSYCYHVVLLLGGGEKVVATACHSSERRPTALSAARQDAEWIARWLGGVLQLPVA